VSKLVSSVQLDHLRHDTIKWKFTKDGMYTAPSAYGLQDAIRRSSLHYLQHLNLEGVGVSKMQNISMVSHARSLLIILLEVWSVTRKYAFNPPEIRFRYRSAIPPNAPIVDRLIP
jgi:hypothetical protein